MIDERVPQEVRLSGGEAQALARLHDRIVVQPVAADTYSVLSEGVVGAASISGINVVIRPRLSVPSVLWLMSWTRRLRFLRDVAAVAAEESLLDGIAHIFAESLQRRLSRGLSAGYRSREEALMGVRGRLRFADQARWHFTMVLPAEVTYDDFSVDTDLNRVLKAATRRLLRMPLLSPMTKRSLQRMLKAFDLVADVRPSSVSCFQEAAHDAHTRSLIALAHLILAGQGLDLNEGGVTAPALLVDMWAVFEDFLTEALRQVLPPGLRLEGQNTDFSLDQDGLLSLRPDLTVWDGGRCIALGDAKYKRTSHGADADVYQMFSYCTAVGVERGTLIYAEGPPAPLTHRVVNSAIEIDIIGLDLDGGPAQLELQIAALLERMMGPPPHE